MSWKGEWNTWERGNKAGFGKETGRKQINLRSRYKWEVSVGTNRKEIGSDDVNLIDVVRDRRKCRERPTVATELVASK